MPVFLYLRKRLVEIIFFFTLLIYLALYVFVDFIENKNAREITII